jgi:hypothetical protein
MQFISLRLLLFAMLILSAPLTTFAHMITGEVVAVADGDTITVYDSYSTLSILRSAHSADLRMDKVELNR